MGVEVTCPTDCAECVSVYSYDCASCRDTNKYLYNGKCYTTCPSGSFRTTDSSRTRICQSCHSNCDTCDGAGNTRCLTCATNKIK